MALEKGTQTAPTWLHVLEAAREWSVKPWEISEHPRPIVWWIRYVVLYKVRAKVDRKLEKKWERAQRR